MGSNLPCMINGHKTCSNHSLICRVLKHSYLDNTYPYCKMPASSLFFKHHCVWCGESRDTWKRKI